MFNWELCLWFIKSRQTAQPPSTFKFINSVSKNKTGTSLGQNTLWVSFHRPSLGLGPKGLAHVWFQHHLFTRLEAGASMFLICLPHILYEHLKHHALTTGTHQTQQAQSKSVAVPAHVGL